jgi:omega-amidase
MLSKLAKETSTYIIGGSIPEMLTPEKIFNTSLCFDRDGAITTQHRK